MDGARDLATERRKNNRRVGIVLALLATSVFVSVIFRQWVDGNI
jgi:hypothetical protein